jgi:hypothetical protein
MGLRPATSSLHQVLAQAQLDLVRDVVITAVTMKITILRIYPEDIGSVFLLNDVNVPDYTASHPRQEVLGRNNRLLSFDKTRTAQRVTPQKCLPRCGNVFTEPLPSNKKGVHRQTHRDMRPTTLLLLRVFVAAETYLQNRCLAT